jgi:hypothetical protein
LLNAYFEIRATKQLQIKLDDNNYNESELISVKVPVEHLSYCNSSDQFVRVEGQIEIEGLQYSYVKRRLYNDSIEMLCIPNHTAIHLTKARNEFYKLVNDLRNPGQEKKTDSHISKNFTGEYCTVDNLLRIENLFSRVQNNYFDFSGTLPFVSLSAEEHPPQVIS